MADVVITVESVSKTYTIRHQNAPDDRLRHVIQSLATAPFRWLVDKANGSGRGGTLDQGAAAKIEQFDALKQVSFTVERGEVVGIIGRNGAGKSTLLKILSRITDPTDGRVRIRGRVASLLEIGTGFHPEFTGRENIFLNGAVLGMTRDEIERRFDEIVAFAGVEKFLDTPVKRFSSGMHVRLAFSVAAHLEPEILIVDEVLAVGDAEFQRKCLGKMRDVTGQGRTVLFVSHNLAAVRNLCSRVILLEQGAIVSDGPVAEVVGAYLQKDYATSAVASGEDLARKARRSYWGATESDVLICRQVALLNADGQPRDQFSSEEEITIAVTYECRETHHDFRLTVAIVDEENVKVLTTQTADDPANAIYRLVPGVYSSRCSIPPNLFGEKRFYVSVWLTLPLVEIVALERVLAFDVSFAGYNNIQYMAYKESLLRPRLPWHHAAVANAGGADVVTGIADAGDDAIGADTKSDSAVAR